MPKPDPAAPERPGDEPGRDGMAALIAENTALRDWQYERLVEDRKHNEQVSAAALRTAQDRSLDMAVRALDRLRDQIRHLAKQAAEAGGSPALSIKAQSLLIELDREPAPGSAEQLLADIRAAHERNLAARTAMWNVLIKHGLTHEIGEITPMTTPTEPGPTEPATQAPPEPHDLSAGQRLRVTETTPNLGLGSKDRYAQVEKGTTGTLEYLTERGGTPAAVLRVAGGKSGHRVTVPSRLVEPTPDKTTPDQHRQEKF